MDFVNLSISSKQSRFDSQNLREMQALPQLEYCTLLHDKWHVQHEFTVKLFAVFLPPQLHPSASYCLKREEC